MSNFKEKIEKLIGDLNRMEFAYNVLNKEHSMMLEELGLSTEITPTREIVKTAIMLRGDVSHAVKET